VNKLIFIFRLQLSLSDNTLCINHYCGMTVSTAHQWGIEMAERKSALKRAPDRPELQKLLEKAKSVIVTDDMLQEQRASFVYGNAPAGSRITKESATAASKRIRVTTSDAA
jgi:hypothetical protein